MWFLPGVDLHVHLQKRASGEAFSAGLAAVLLPDVPADVALELNRVSELPSAEVTLIGSLPRVDPAVDAQRPLGGKMLPAGLAAVRLLSVVTPHVDVQLVHPAELLPAGVALAQHVARVVQHVVVQIDLAVEAVLAVVAAVRLLAGVDLEVDLQGVDPAELFPAGVTLIGPLPRVDSHVSRQKGLG